MRITESVYKAGLKRRYLDLKELLVSKIEFGFDVKPSDATLLEMQTIRTIAVLNGWLNEVGEESEE